MHRKFPNIFVGADAHLSPNVRTLPLHFAPSAAAVQTQRQYSTFKAPCKAPSNVWHAPQRPKQYGAHLGSQETLVSCGVLWLLSFAEESALPIFHRRKKRTEARASVRLHMLRKINYPYMRSQNARTRAVDSSSPSTWIIPCRSGVFSRPVSAKRTKDDTSAMEPL